MTPNKFSRKYLLYCLGTKFVCSFSFLKNEAYNLIQPLSFLPERSR